MALKLNDKIVLSGGLPRIQYPNGDVKPAVRTLEVGATVIVLQDVPGKKVGVELDSPGDNLRWYDAHECDGLAPMGFGWWISEESIAKK